MKAIKINGEFQVLQSPEFNKFMDSTPENSTINFEIITDKKYRTIQHNRYLRGIVYKAFMGVGNFRNIQEVHIHFSKKYLMDEVSCNMDSVEEINEMIKVISKASEAVGIISQKKVDNIWGVTYVKSTKFLDAKGMNEYINYLVLEAGEMGISFEKFEIEKCY